MADPIRKILGLAARATRRKSGRFSFAKSGPVTAIDFDGKVVRVVHSVRRGGKTEITRCARENLERSVVWQSSDPQADGKCLAEALGRLKLKSGSIIMAVPRALVFLRNVTLPATGTTEELAAMVHFQVTKDLPFRPEEAVIDFTVLRTLAAPSPPEANGLEPAPAAAGKSSTSAKVELLVAVIKKDVVEHYSRIAAAAGFRLASLGLRSCANARCVGAAGVANGDQAVALLSLRPDEVTVDIIVGQALAFSRVASIAPADENAPPSGDAGVGTGAEPDAGSPAAPALPPQTEAGFIQAVTTELLRSLHSYDGLSDRRPVEKILVASGAGNEQGLVEALSRRFGIPCAVLSAAELGLNLAEDERSAGALPAVGLALGAHDSEGLPLDFLHPKQPPIPRDWRKIKLLAAAGVGAILLFSLMGFRSHLIKQKTQVKEQVQTQVSQAEKNRVHYRDMRLKAKTVREWTAEGRIWLDHYAYLSLLLPPSQDVYITSLSTGARGVIHLAVQARSGEVLAQMDKRLREAGYEVKPLAITPGVDKFGYSFRSSVELTLPQKMKMELSALKAPMRPPDDHSLESAAPTKNPAAEKPPANAAASGGTDGPPRRGRRSKP